MENGTLIPLIAAARLLGFTRAGLHERARAQGWPMAKLPQQGPRPGGRGRIGFGIPRAIIEAAMGRPLSDLEIDIAVAAEPACPSCRRPMGVKRAAPEPLTAESVLEWLRRNHDLDVLIRALRLHLNAANQNRKADARRIVAETKAAVLRSSVYT